MTRVKALLPTVITIGIVALGVSAVVAQSGNDLFQQALVKERTDGNIGAAIALYRTIVQQHESDRTLVAKALVQMGGCYEKLGSGDAITTYARVVREFGDQKESVVTAQTRLAALQSPARVQVGQVSSELGSFKPNSKTNNPLAPPSTDGRYLSFTDPETLAVALLDLRTNKTRRFTNSGVVTEYGEYADYTAVSPNGRQVAYTWDGSGGYDLRVLQTSGSDAVKPRIVYRGEYLQLYGWTPDGRSVLVSLWPQDDTYQIASISIADGSVRVLKNLGSRRADWVSLSPDGALAYEVREKGNSRTRDIFVLTADGNETPVVEDPADDRFPVWSPDGSTIVFRSNRTGSVSLWAVSVEGGQPRRPAELVKSDIGDVQPLGMLRSGALVYASQRSTSNAYIAQLDAKLNAGAPPLAVDRRINSSSRPVWSPDGQQLAFFTSREQLVIRSLRTGADRMVPRSGIRASSPVRWFPDGQSVLVTSPDPHNRQMGLYRLDTTTGSSDLLVTGNPTFDLSPDGKVIFYSKGANVMRLDMESRRETVLTAGGRFGSLALSPDGARLAYVAYRSRGETLAPHASSPGRESVEVIPATGGEPREVCRTASDTGPSPSTEGLAWTPDQRFLLVVASPGVDQNKQAIWRVPVTGGAPEKLAISMDRMGNPRVHPEGRELAFDSATESIVLLTLENFLPKQRASK